MLTREAVRAPFTARALRELLFCLLGVPLGLCVLAFPIALAGLPSGALVHGIRRGPAIAASPSRGGHSLRL